MDIFSLSENSTTCSSTSRFLKFKETLMDALNSRKRTGDELLPPSKRGREYFPIEEGIFKLPSEIILSIFKNLEGKDLYEASLSCRTFRDLINYDKTFILSRYLESCKSSEYVDRIVYLSSAMELGDSLKKFGLAFRKERKYHEMENFVRRCPNLKAIQLDFFPDLCDEDLQCLHLLPKLKEFYLGEVYHLTEKAFRYLPTQLEWIDFYTGCQENHSVTDNTLAYLSNFEKLKLLNLDYCEAYTFQGLKFLIDLPCLETLNLIGKIITEEGLSYILQMKALKTLVIGDEEENLPIVEKLKTLKPNLRIAYEFPEDCLKERDKENGLDKVRGGEKFDKIFCLLNSRERPFLKEFIGLPPELDLHHHNTLEKLFYKCPNMESINFSFFPDLEEQDFGCLPLLSNLKRFYMEKACSFHERAFEFLPTHLEVVYFVLGSLEGIVNEYGVSDRTLEHLSNFKNLKKLGLNHSEKITNEGLGFLKDHPSLVELHLCHFKLDLNGARYICQMPALKMLTLSPAETSETILEELKRHGISVKFGSPDSFDTFDCFEY